MRPRFTYLWWWLVKKEEWENYLSDFFVGLLIFLKKLWEIKIPLAFFLLFIIIVLALPKKEKIITKEIIKIDTFKIIRRDTIIKYLQRATHHWDTIWITEREIKSETAYQKIIETKTEKVIETKKIQKPLEFSFGASNQLPFKIENTKIFTGIDFNISKIDLYGKLNYNIDKKNLDNEIGIKIKF